MTEIKLGILCTVESNSIKLKVASKARIIIKTVHNQGQYKRHVKSAIEWNIIIKSVRLLKAALL